jgi:hypothetical protein
MPSKTEGIFTSLNNFTWGKMFHNKETVKIRKTSSHKKCSHSGLHSFSF